MEVLVSKNIANQLARIRKAIANKQTCRLIQCKPLKSIGYSAADKSKSAIELKLPKSELGPSIFTQKPDKVKQGPKTKEKESPEPRIESTTQHSVTKKTKYETTTKKNKLTTVYFLAEIVQQKV